MKTSLLALMAGAVAAMLATPLAAQERPAGPAAIAWIDNPAAALRDHQNEPKALVVYVTASFCHYCVQMERDTWSHPAVAARLRTGYRALKVSADHYGSFVDRLGVQSFPTTIVFGADGNRVATIPGYVTPAELLPQLPAVRPVAAAPVSPAPGGSL